MSGRLPPMPYKDFTDILKANGFKHDRSKGGHEVWEKTITDSISIPVHGDINGGIARRLIREHRLKEWKTIIFGGVIWKKIIEKY